MVHKVIRILCQHCTNNYAHVT